MKRKIQDIDEDHVVAKFKKLENKSIPSIISFNVESYSPLSHLHSLLKCKLSERLQEYRVAITQKDAIKLWSTSPKHPSRSLKFTKTFPARHSIQLADGRIAAGELKTLYIWDIETGHVTKIETNFRVLFIAQLSNGMVITGGDHKFDVWNITDNSHVHGCHISSMFTLSMTALSNDILATGDMALKLWNPMTSQALKTYDCDIESIVCILEFNDDILCAGGFNGKIAIWDRSSAQLLRTLNGKKRVGHIAKVGLDKIASVAWRRQSIKIWNVNGTFLTKLKCVGTPHNFMETEKGVLAVIESEQLSIWSVDREVCTASFKFSQQYQNSKVISAIFLK
jgi:WD40 repeat protein